MDTQTLIAPATHSRAPHTHPPTLGTSPPLSHNTDSAPNPHIQVVPPLSPPITDNHSNSCFLRACCAGRGYTLCSQSMTLILYQAGSLCPRPHCEMLAQASLPLKSKLFLPPHTWTPHSAPSGARVPSPGSLTTPLSYSSPGLPLPNSPISVNFSASSV